MANQVITFGCRLNSYESQAIKQAVADSKENNLTVFNSCAVTAESERQLRQAIRKAAQENPQNKIIVTGCAAQINPEKYAAMPEVTMVLGNEEKIYADNYSFSKNISGNKLKNDQNKIVNNPTAHKDRLFTQEKNLKNQSDHIFINHNMEEKIMVNDIMAVKQIHPHLITGFDDKSRAFVQIQNGCNHRCTFCIIPYGRGNSRSVAFGQIVKQVKELVSKGYKEIVLTGVDITDYGKDLISDLTFAGMIKRLLKLVPELPRLRISSIDVAEVDNDPDFLDLIANEERFMPHLHISLQAGDDIILKRMARRHNRMQVINFCNKVRKLRDNITFGADIIAGFPTETEAMFNNSVNLIHEAGIVFNHIFPYSPRTGTPASKMPQINKEIRKQRARELRKAGEIELYKFLDGMIGTKQKIILENNFTGRCENFTTAIINNDPNLQKGAIYTALIKSRTGDKLIAELI